MLVVSFAASGDGNCIVVADRPYVLARTERGSFLLRATCPHRGGPLHLAQFDGSGTTLVCPWHENRYACRSSREAAIPLVRSANRVTAVFPAGEEYVREYRPVSGCLGGNHASGPQPRPDHERGHDRPRRGPSSRTRRPETSGPQARTTRRPGEAGPGSTSDAATRSEPS